MSAEDRQSKHRSVYGLIFVVVVYVGILVMMGAAWPRFVDQMLLPRLERERLAASALGEAGPPEPVDRESLVRGLPAVIRILYLASGWIARPLGWVLFAVPIALGIAFERRVRDDRLKTYIYYATSALLGLAVLVGAGLVIFEVLDFAQPPGGGGAAALAPRAGGVYIPGDSESQEVAARRVVATWPSWWSSRGPNSVGPTRSVT